MSMKLPQLLNVYNSHMFYSAFRPNILPSTPWILRIVEKPSQWNPPGFESHLNQSWQFCYPSEKYVRQIGSFSEGRDENTSLGIQSPSDNRNLNTLAFWR